jgi:hypothetical protein
MDIDEPQPQPPQEQQEQQEQPPQSQPQPQQAPDLGLRAQYLYDAYVDIVDRILEKLTLEALGPCYPTVYEWMLAFEQALKRNDAVRKFKQVDAVAAEAKIRKEDAVKEAGPDGKPKVPVA